jgi:Thioesterase-like superfamily
MSGSCLRNRGSVPAVPDFIYSRAGDLYTPTEWAGSPWSRELQHGGPVCGLVAHAAEAAAGETGLRVVRLTVDLCRPTPLAPLTLAWQYVRRGRRLALVEVRLRHGDTDVTRGTALLLAANAELASTWRQPEPPPPGPEGLEPIQFMPRAYLAQVPPGFHRSVEVRLTEDELGPALWATTPLELLAGQETSALVRAAMLSDLTFALSGRLLLRRGLVPLDPRRVALINADVTLYLERAPEGEWIAMRSGSVGDCEGIGIAEVAQLDRRGRYGRSLQALVSNPAG